jgi:hypothetical protein
VRMRVVGRGRGRGRTRVRAMVIAGVLWLERA